MGQRDIDVPENRKQVPCESRPVTRVKFLVFSKPNHSRKDPAKYKTACWSSCLLLVGMLLHNPCWASVYFRGNALHFGVLSWSFCWESWKVANGPAKWKMPGVSGWRAGSTAIWASDPKDLKVMAASGDDVWTHERKVLGEQLSASLPPELRMTGVGSTKRSGSEWCQSHTLLLPQAFLGVCPLIAKWDFSKACIGYGNTRFLPSAVSCSLDSSFCLLHSRELGISKVNNDCYCWLVDTVETLF